MLEMFTFFATVKTNIVCDDISTSPTNQDYCDDYFDICEIGRPDSAIFSGYCPGIVTLVFDQVIHQVCIRGVRLLAGLSEQNRGAGILLENRGLTQRCAPCDLS